MRKALDLDPLSLILNSEYARSFYFLHQFEKAEERYRKTMELDSSSAIARKGLADILMATGRYGEALSEIQRALEDSGGSLFIRDDLGYVHALSGEREKAGKVLGELKAASAKPYVPPTGSR